MTDVRFESYLVCRRIVAFATEENDPFPRFYDPHDPEQAAILADPTVLKYGQQWCLYAGIDEFILAFSDDYRVVAEVYEKITGFPAPPEPAENVLEFQLKAY